MTTMFILQCVFAGIGIISFIVGCIFGFVIDDIRYISIARWLLPVSGIILIISTFFGVFVIAV